MNFFGINNYNKPGPGVKKDAPPQAPLVRFFAIIARKFFDLVKLNLLFIVPFAIAFFLMILLNYVPEIANTYLTLFPFVFISPFIAGVTIVTRNYALEKHAFIYSDYKDCIKENWKAFLINAFICYLVLFIIGFAINYYASDSFKNPVSFILMAICISILLLFIFSQYYVPVMIVTFDLKLNQIYKNAVMFSIIGLWRNLLLTVLLAGITYALYLMLSMVLTIIIDLIISIFILFSFCMFLINFIVYPLINKTMIKPEQNIKN